MAIEAAFYPESAPIDAYGNGGFRFAGTSHVGSLLFLPYGVYAWEARDAQDITEESLAKLFADAGQIDVVFVGTGATQVFLKPTLGALFKNAGIVVEAMATGAAARTYNILLSEKRAVAAALLAVNG